MEMYKANDNRYADMAYRRCGRSGLLLPVISLGLWHNFGSVDVFSNFIQIAYAAFDNGITHFDLANNYGPVYGSAEENFGRILKKGLGQYRDELVISTKAGYDMWPGPYGNWGSRKYLMASLDQSLKRMGLEYVDIFYSHRCLIHQARYSMLDRRIEPDLLPLLKQEGVGMIAFSPLAQGMLTDKYLNGIPDNSRAAKSTGHLQREQVTEEKINKVRQLNDLAKQRGQTLAEMAIAWLLKDDRVTSVLVGASSVAQLIDNLKALQNTAFSAEEIQMIENILQ